MAIEHDDVIEVERLDLYVLSPEQKLVRPCLIVTTDSMTRAMLDGRVAFIPKQMTELQSNDETEQ